MWTYGTVDRQYLPNLLIAMAGAYEPAPGTLLLIIIASGSVTLNTEKISTIEE